MVAALACAGAPAAFSQQLLAPGSEAEKRAAAGFEEVAASKANPRLTCSVTRFPPRLSFGLRYWTGFDAEIPANEFSSAQPVSIITALRVTPRGGRPAYFYSARRLPEFPPGFKFSRGTVFTTGGGFALGAGDYQVELVLIDSSDRVCRGNWKVSAKAGKLALRMAAGELASSFVDEWTGIPSRAKAGGRVTIMLHAAPVYRRRNAVRLSSWDLTILLGSLVSLLETSRYSEARVVAYNLDAKRVLFDESTFDAKAYQRLVMALRGLDLGTVSVGTLSAGGPDAVLEDLIARERQQKRSSDAVVFMGPVSRYAAKVTPRLRELRMELPYSFGVLFLPFPTYPEDLVTKFVKAGGGRVVDVFQPEDLARAIKLLDEKGPDSK